MSRPVLMEACADRRAKETSDKKFTCRDCVDEMIDQMTTIRDRLRAAKDGSELDDQFLSLFVAFIGNFVMLVYSLVIHPQLYHIDPASADRSRT